MANQSSSASLRARHGVRITGAAASTLALLLGAALSLAPSHARAAKPEKPAKPAKGDKPAGDAPAGEKLTIEEIMEKTHKGKESMVARVGSAKPDPKEVTTLLGYYQQMAADKPGKGDEASWKKKTGAVIEALEGIKAGKPKSAEAFKTAINCKACHSVHKG